jgi:hypothetical protein
MLFRETGMKNVLLYKFLALNAFCFSLLGAFFYQGFIQRIAQTDSTYIITSIAAVFIVGYAITVSKVLALNSALNSMHPERGMPSSPEALKMLGASNIQVIRHIASVLPMLGLVGTAVGIVIALGAMEAVDPARIGQLITNLFRGLSLKFYSTIVGIVLYIWTMANYMFLSTYTQRLIARVIEIRRRRESIDA